MALFTFPTLPPDDPWKRCIVLYYEQYAPKTARNYSTMLRLTWGDLEQQDDTWLYHFRGKGRAHIDDVAVLPRPAASALLAYLIASSRLESMEASSPLWLDHRGKHALGAAGISRRLARYAHLAGLPAISLHWLRHSAARARYYEVEQDLLSMKELLRHSSLDTTYRYLQRLKTPTDPWAVKLEEKWKL